MGVAWDKLAVSTNLPMYVYISRKSTNYDTNCVSNVLNRTNQYDISAPLHFDSMRHPHRYAWSAFFCVNSWMWGKSTFRVDILPFCRLTRIFHLGLISQFEHQKYLLIPCVWVLVGQKVNARPGYVIMVYFHWWKGSYVTSYVWPASGCGRKSENKWIS